jgi:hypothetical protein
MNLKNVMKVIGVVFCLFLGTILCKNYIFYGDTKKEAVDTTKVVVDTAVVDTTKTK